MNKAKYIALWLVLYTVAVIRLPYAHAQTDDTALPQAESVLLAGSVTVSGRIMRPASAQPSELILHSTEALAYALTGPLLNELGQALTRLGEHNLVTVSGQLDGSSSVICTRTTDLSDTVRGELAIDTTTACIRYHNLLVTNIVSTRISDKPLPALQRETAAETTYGSAATGQPFGPPAILGEITGTIASISSRSPIKTIQIKNLDTSSPLEGVSMILTGTTRIARKIKDAPPETLSPDRLKAGQRVTATYARSDLKTEAMLITVTGE